MHRQEVHDPLCEAHKEKLIVDQRGRPRPRALRLLSLAVRVMQEYEIEVRRVAELHSAKLAVAHHADAHRPAAGTLTAHRHTELRGNLPPTELNRVLDDDLRDLGEPVAHTHHRYPPGEIGHGHAEDRKALEMTQRFDLALGIVVIQLLESRARLVFETRATGQLRQTLVNELVEKQRMGGNLLSQEVSVPTQFDQPLTSGGVFVQ